MTKWLALGMLLAVLVFVPLVTMQWRHAEKKSPGRPLRFLLWLLVLGTTAQSITTSLGNESLANVIFTTGSLALPAVLVAGAVAALADSGMSTNPIVPGLLLLLAGLQFVSTLFSGQLNSVGYIIILGLIYLPGFTLILWKNPGPVIKLRQTLIACTGLVVWGSLAFQIVDPVAAASDLPRRYAVGSLTDRLSGVTPHPNLLAFAAGTMLILLVGTKVRLRTVHLSACLVILVLTEARTETVSLVAAFAAYRIVSGTGSRTGRLVWLTLVGAAGWLLAGPTLMNSVNSSELGSDVGTFNGRVAAWDLVEASWPLKPIFGWGAFVFDDRTGTALSNTFFLNAQNQFLEALIETGLLGALCVVVLAVALLYKTLSSNDGPYAAMVVSMLIFSLTEVPLTLHNFAFNFSVTASVLMLCVIIPGPRDVPARLAEKVQKPSEFTVHRTASQAGAG